jgi:undecaprenyl phosphate-alpha-L-ara4N flippase subunit ArnE
MPIWIHGLLLTSSLAAAGGQMMLKQGATGRSAFIAFANPWIAGGLFVYALSTALWVFALSRAPLTLVYPYTALTFVLVYLSGAIVFREAIPAQAIAGAALILLGLLLINFSRAVR